MENTNRLSLSAAKVFATTRWSVIAACSDDNQVRAGTALSEVCQSYWQPVYACIRHQGHSVHDAQDLTQEFFVHLLKGRWSKDLDAAKGRFRSYLSVALRHFLVSHHRRRWTLWRGWGKTVVSFDADEAEGRYQQALTTQASPETLYERHWAIAVIDQALGQLLIEMRAAGKEALFNHFEAILSAQTRTFPYEELAKTLDLTVGTLHVALHRWRGRLRALLREEIERTVTSKIEIDAELEHLQRLTGRPL